MKTIIAGSREITDYSIVESAIAKSGFKITEVVSGNANGVDRLGEEWAKKNDIGIRMFPAMWADLGKKAGILRNQQMAIYADALIAIWDGKSKGTSNMVKQFTETNKPMFVVVITDERTVTLGITKT